MHQPDGTPAAIANRDIVNGDTIMDAQIKQAAARVATRFLDSQDIAAIARHQGIGALFAQLADYIKRSEEHTSGTPVTNAHLVCRLLLEKKKDKTKIVQCMDYDNIV